MLCVTLLIVVGVTSGLDVLEGLTAVSNQALYTEKYIGYVVRHSRRMTSVVWSKTPLDVIDNIGDQLAGLILDPETPDRDTDSLCPGKIPVACVTCKTWVIACRRIWFKAEITFRTIEDIHQLHMILQHPLPVDLPTLFIRVVLKWDGVNGRPFDRRWAWSLASILGYLPFLQALDIVREHGDSPLFWSFQPRYPDFRHIRVLYLTHCRFHSFSVLARQIGALSNLLFLGVEDIQFVVGHPPLQILPRVQVAKQLNLLAAVRCGMHWPFAYLLAGSAFHHFSTRDDAVAVDNKVQLEYNLLLILKIVRLLEISSSSSSWKPLIFSIQEIGGKFPQSESLHCLSINAI